MASVAVATRTRSATLTRSESQVIATVLTVNIAVIAICAVVNEIPTGRLVSTEVRRGPAYDDLPVAKPVAKDEVVQVAVPVYDHYAFQQLETAARTQDLVYHKAASATV